MTEERLNFSRQRKQSLEERGEALKAHKARMKENVKERKVQLEVRQATAARRLKRLVAIKNRMGLSHADFRDMLGMTEKHWRVIYDGKRPVVLGILKLAEIYLTRFLAKEHRKEEPKVVPVIPEQYEQDAELQSNVLLEYVSGASEEEIASKFALRPEIVAYYLSKLT